MGRGDIVANVFKPSSQYNVATMKKHTDETKRKISEASKGENNPNWGKRGDECSWYGRKHSKEKNEAKK